MVASWCEAFLQSGMLPLPLLVRCSCICRQWLHDVRNAVATARRLEFGDFCARVQGRDIKRLLRHMAGVNLQAVDLRGCHVSADDMQDILSSIANSCPGVDVIDITGFDDITVLRAIATQIMLHRSPAVLHSNLLNHKAATTELVPFSQCYMDSSTLRLTFDALALPSHALLEASRRGDHLVASLLLNVCFPREQGQDWVFDCNAHDRNGRGALHFASMRGCDKLVSLLIGACSDVNAADIQGNTPLLLACAAGSISAATRLLDASADCGVKTVTGNTPLLAACQAGCFDVAKLLLSRDGSDLDTARMDGATPFSLAVASGQTELILILLKHLEGRFTLPQEARGVADEDVVAKLRRVAQLYLEDGNISAWLASGVSGRAIVGEIGALLSSSVLDDAMKQELRRRRAVVNGTIWQPARLSALSVDSEGSASSRPLHTIYAADGIQSVAVHGRRLARAEGTHVVVSDLLTGFEELRMRGDAMRSLAAAS